MSLSLDTFLPYRLNRLAEATSDQIRPIYRDLYGLNRPEWRTLIVLHHLRSATATQICQHSNQHKTKVSRAVHALEQRRWLRREITPNDRRSEILSLTEAGRAPSKAWSSQAAPARPPSWTACTPRIAPRWIAGLRHWNARWGWSGRPDGSAVALDQPVAEGIDLGPVAHLFARHQEIRLADRQAIGEG